MKEKYTNRHLNFVAALTSNNKISIKKNNYVINPALNTVKANVPLNLDPEILEFYNEIQDTQISWRYNEDAVKLNFLDEERDFVEGEFNQVDKAIFLQGIDSLWLRENFGMELNREFVGTLFPFEELHEEFMCCINIEAPDQLVFLDFDEGDQHCIPVNFRTYLEYGYANYFFYGWQKAIFLESKFHLKQLNHYLSQIVLNYKIK